MHTPNPTTPTNFSIAQELTFLCPRNLIRGVVKGEDFVRPVQAFMFQETFLEMFLWCHTPLSTLYKLLELQFQHAACTSKVHTKCPTVLYASSFFSHPHWPYITTCCFTFYSKYMVAMLLLVVVNKPSVQSMKFTRNLINNSSLQCSQGITV